MEENNLSGKKTYRTAEQKKALMNRLKRIEGQIKGLQKLVETDAYCNDILQQSMSAGSAIDGFNQELLGYHIAECVVDGIRDYVKKRCEEDGRVSFESISIEKGPFRATPAIVETENSFVRLIETEITRTTGINEFIHQYHGGSDIRFPIIYGNSRCVGIGPSCRLPRKGSGDMEWISIDDYINGIKILAALICDYSDFIGR